MVDASEQLTILNEKLTIQRVAVTEKTEACETLLKEISTATQQAEEKKKLAIEKGKEIEEQNKIIKFEKVQPLLPKNKISVTLLFIPQCSYI